MMAWEPPPVSIEAGFYEKEGSPVNHASAGFRAHILEWLKRDGGHPEAVSVEAVSGRGSDWNGSTEGGFYSTFSVDITWRDAEGKKGWEDFDGEKMGSLWSWVVNVFPSAPVPSDTGEAQ